LLGDGFDSRIAVRSRRLLATVVIVADFLRRFWFRWLVDRRLRKTLASKKSERKNVFQAEADRSPGVLLASGYIAGGAIAGIIIAIMAGAFDQVDDSLTKWSRANNPFFEGSLRRHALVDPLRHYVDIPMARR